MKSRILLAFFICLLALENSFSLQVETFYGSIDVEEPVLIELIESPAFQRLRSIHQYGVSYYTNYKEEYSRYDHSLGVFVILRKNKASLEEQVAGLLHDVSHTVFSHVGDWIFGKENQEKDYQNSIHKKFLTESGLEVILNKYQLTTDQILPIEELFPMLEQGCPNLCADRIEYNIQGAYHQGFLTKEESLEIFEDLRFEQGVWVSSLQDLMKKVVLFSLFMTENCWGSVDNHLASRLLADAILRAVDLNLISFEKIHFGVDQEVWGQLMGADDPIIQGKMKKLFQVENLYFLVEDSQSDLVIKSKFRGINPWISSSEGLIRLIEMDNALVKEYVNVKERMEKGWGVKFYQEYGF